VSGDKMSNLNKQQIKEVLNNLSRDFKNLPLSVFILFDEELSMVSGRGNFIALVICYYHITIYRLKILFIL